MADSTSYKAQKVGEKHKYSNMINRTTSESIRLSDSDKILNHPTSLTAASVIPRKKTSFQITSVTVGGHPSNDGGDDSADDLDESHAEDISDVIDTSRATDIENETPSYSEDTFSKDDVFFNSSTSLGSAPVIPTSSQYGLAIVSTPEGCSNILNANTSGGNNTSSNDLHVNVSDNVINLGIVGSKHLEGDMRDLHSHTGRNERFKVVKIESTEPFKRGRWMCMDFLDHTMSQQHQLQSQGSVITSNDVRTVESSDISNSNVNQFAGTDSGISLSDHPNIVSALDDQGHIDHSVNVSSNNTMQDQQNYISHSAPVSGQNSVSPGQTMQYSTQGGNMVQNVMHTSQTQVLQQQSQSLTAINSQHSIHGANQHQSLQPQQMQQVLSATNIHPQSPSLANNQIPQPSPQMQQPNQQIQQPGQQIQQQNQQIHQQSQQIQQQNQQIQQNQQQIQQQNQQIQHQTQQIQQSQPIQQQNQQIQQTTQQFQQPNQQMQHQGIPIQHVHHQHHQSQPSNIVPQQYQQPQIQQIQQATLQAVQQNTQAMLQQQPGMPQHIQHQHISMPVQQINQGQMSMQMPQTVLQNQNSMNQIQQQATQLPVHSQMQGSAQHLQHVTVQQMSMAGVVGQTPQVLPAPTSQQQQYHIHPTSQPMMQPGIQTQPNLMPVQSQYFSNTQMTGVNMNVQSIPNSVLQTQAQPNPNLNLQQSYPVNTINQQQTQIPISHVIPPSASIPHMNQSQIPTSGVPVMMPQPGSLPVVNNLSVPSTQNTIISPQATAQGSALVQQQYITQPVASSVGSSHSSGGLQSYASSTVNAVPSAVDNVQVYTNEILTEQTVISSNQQIDPLGDCTGLEEPQQAEDAER